eukprot:g7945.t1
MPGLQLFGRRWAFSSDDLPVPAFFGFVFHGAWLLLIIIFSVYAHSVYNPDECDGAVPLATFMACLLLSLLVSTICDVLILWYGLKGTIFQSSHRRIVNLVMYVLTGNFLLKICITAYGTDLVFIHRPNCLQVTDKLNEVMQAVIISTWVIIFLYIILSVISYQAFPKNSVLQWKRRIRFINCCCCCGSFDQTESEPLARMALVFEKFFKPMDFSPTDTLVAMYLAAKLQIFTRHQSNTEPSSTMLNPPSLFTPSLLFGNHYHEGGGLNTSCSINSPLSNSLTGIELRQTRLAPVQEDDELSVLEGGGQSSTSMEKLEHDFPIPLKTEQQMVSAPGHRRTNAFDFSQVDFSGHFPLDLGSPSPSGSSSSPPMNPDSNSRSPQTADSLGSDSDDSVETTLTWEDDYNGPYLIQTEGMSQCFASRLPNVDFETLDRMYLYHRYALASYGALLYLASGKRFLEQCGRCCGLCIRAAPASLAWSILSRDSSGNYPPRSPSLINRLNEEAVLYYGFQEKDILYRSHHDDFACLLPYFVALDEQDKALVVAVRGTLSWVDIVTDFHIHPETLNEEEQNRVLVLLEEIYGVGQKQVETEEQLSVHSGMLRSARALISSLQNAGLLQFLEEGKLDQLASTNRGDNGVCDLSDWKFVMTGHSLGAGVVSLATLLLKSKYAHKVIECFAISPPACVMSEELANAIAPFCLSLVHGKDIIPRISLLTAERLRDQMVRAATLCKKSKMRVLLSCMMKTKWKKQELFFSPDELDTEPLNAMKEYRSAVKKAEEQDGLDAARKFIPPGRIVFLRPRPRINLTNGSDRLRSFEAVWITGKDLIQEGVILSLFMIKDHFPYFSIESLKEVINERGSY